MQGLQSLVVAMVCKSVEELSDENTNDAKAEAKPPADTPVMKKPASKAKAKPKGGTRKRPAASSAALPAEEANEPGEPAPAASEPPAKKVSKKPAKADFPVRKSYYKDAKRYGFTVNGRECFYVPKLNRFHCNYLALMDATVLLRVYPPTHFLHLSSALQKRRAWATTPGKRSRSLSYVLSCVLVELRSLDVHLNLQPLFITT